MDIQSMLLLLTKTAFSKSIAVRLSFFLLCRAIKGTQSGSNQFVDEFLSFSDRLRSLESWQVVCCAPSDITY
jgi:hypothetical protein